MAYPRPYPRPRYPRAPAGPIPVVIHEKKIELPPWLVAIGSIINGFMFGSFFAPSFYSSDIGVRVASIAVFAFYVLSILSAYIDIIINATVFIMGYVTGATLGVVIGPSIFYYFLKPIFVDSAMAIGKWLVSLAPSNEANILFYPLVTMSWYMVSIGITAMIDSLFLSVLASSLKTPYIAFSIGMLLYLFLGSFNIYMFVATVMYVVISLALANAYIWNWFLQAIASNVMLAIIMVFLMWKFPNFIQTLYTSISSATWDLAYYDYTVEDWDKDIRKVWFIWTGFQLFAPFVAMILGLGKYYYPQYVDMYRSIIVFGGYMLVASILSTASWYAIAVSRRKINPRRVMRVLSLALPAMQWSSLMALMSYDLAPAIAIQAFKDVIDQLGPLLLKFILQWLVFIP